MRSFWELISMDVRRVLEHIPLVWQGVCNSRLRSHYRILLNSRGILLELLEPWSRGKIGYPETSASNCQPTLRYVSEERRHYLHLGGSVKSRTVCGHWLRKNGNACQWVTWYILSSNVRVLWLWSSVLLHQINSSTLFLKVETTVEELKTNLMSLAIYFTYYALNMFRTLIYPSSGACDCVDELPHLSSCSQFVVCWSFCCGWYLVVFV